MPGQEFVNIFKNRFFPGDILKGKKIQQSILPVCFPVKRGDLFQGIQCTGKSKISVFGKIEQGLDPEAVAGEEQGFFLFVIECERKESVQLLQSFCGTAEFNEHRQQHFGIGIGAERVVGEFCFPQFGSIENFAVINQHKPAVRRLERLMSGIAQIDHGKPGMGEPYIPIKKDPAVVRSPLMHGIRHPEQKRFLSIDCFSDVSGDPAHGLFFLRMKLYMCRRPALFLRLQIEIPDTRFKTGLQQTVQNDLLCRFGGVQHVVRKIAVVPQFIQLDLVGGEVRGIVEFFQGMIDPVQQPRLADGVQGQFPGIMPHRREGEDQLAIRIDLPDLPAGGNDRCGTHLRRGKTPLKLVARHFVTIRHVSAGGDMPVLHRTGKRDKAGVRFLQRFQKILPRQFCFFHDLRAGRRRKRTMMPPAVPESVELKKIVRGVLQIDPLQCFCDRIRVVQDPVGVLSAVHPCPEEFPQHIHRETGAEGNDCGFRCDLLQRESVIDRGIGEGSMFFHGSLTLVCSLVKRSEWRGSRTKFRTAMETALVEPTRIMSFLARVMPV